MKKLLSLASILLAFNSFCQSIHPLSLSIQSGYSIATGSFKSNSFANNGFYVNINGEYLLNKHIGADIEFEYGLNPVNAQNYFNYWNDKTGDYGSIHTHIGNQMITTPQNDCKTNLFYRYFSCLIGPTFNLPINNKGSIELKALIGYSELSTPDGITNAIESNYTIYQDKLNMQSICYNPELSYQLNLNNHWVASANISYFYCKFKNYTSSISYTKPFDTNIYTSQFSQSMIMSCIFTGLSVKYKF